MPAAFLSDRSLVRVAGPDAEHFLQNLITTDVNANMDGKAFPGALLTPQGKILFDFMIWRDGHGFVLDTSASQAEGLIKRLTLYKLRAKIEISGPDPQGVTVRWGEEPVEGAFEDMRFEPADVYVSRQPGRHGDVPEAAYHALRIFTGIAESGADFALQDAFPHDVMLDLTHGLSFKKGCYVGQEVVSRMHHRGTARRRVVSIMADAALPAAGTEITAGGKPAGTLGTVAGKRGLAIVRTDRIASAHAAGGEILAGEVPIALSLAPWTGLAFVAAAEEA